MIRPGDVVTDPLPCVLGHPADKPAERYGQLLICRRHYRWLDSTLTQIMELFALTPLVLMPGRTGSGRNTDVYAPAPLRLEVAALTDRRARNTVEDPFGDPEGIPDVPGTLWQWVRMIAEERPCYPPESATVMASTSFLHRERHWIGQQAWVDDYATEMVELHRSLARVVGETMFPRPVGHCPNCAKPLFLTGGVDLVECKRCGSAWTGVALARLMARLNLASEKVV